MRQWIEVQSKAYFDDLMATLTNKHLPSNDKEAHVSQKASKRRNVKDSYNQSEEEEQKFQPFLQMLKVLLHIKTINANLLGINLNIILYILKIFLSQ